MLRYVCLSLSSFPVLTHVDHSDRLGHPRDAQPASQAFPSLDILKWFSARSAVMNPVYNFWDYQEKKQYDVFQLRH